MLSYTAAARTREFAIRLAPGSGHRALARLVLRPALLLTRIFGQVTAFRPDAGTCAAVAALLCAITVLACALPAVRVVALDPAAALRQD